MSCPDALRRLVLLLRSCFLSDGCKVTLSTVYCFSLERSCFPSVAELARLRGVTEMTVRNHIAEALEHGALTHNRHGTVSQFFFEWDALAKSVGFADENEVILTEAVKVAMPRGSVEEEIRSRISRPKNYRELMPYFKALYREKCGSAYTTEKADAMRLYNLARQYGVDGATEMIDFFARHRGRLMIGEFSIKVLFMQRHKILTSMERKR